MVNAMWVSALVGAVCAFLSAYLMLKGWSLIGDALSHAIVPGVAGAYMLGLPFAVGAFFSGGLAAACHAVPDHPDATARGRCGDRADLHLLLRHRPVHGVAFAGFGEHPDHRARQHPRRDARRHAAARHHRWRLAGDSHRQMEGPDGHLLRREPCKVDRPQSARAAEVCLFFTLLSRLHGRRAADGRVPSSSSPWS
jgi:hypothetical protein